jgi:hypothetical protein
MALTAGLSFRASFYYGLPIRRSGRRSTGCNNSYASPTMESTPRRTPPCGCGPCPLKHVRRKKTAQGASQGDGERVSRLTVVEAAEQALELRVWGCGHRVLGLEVEGSSVSTGVGCGRVVSDGEGG